MVELLKADGLAQVFGGLRAVSNFNMVIEKGELIGLIGPNGAGKTTLLRAVLPAPEGPVMARVRPGPTDSDRSSTSVSPRRTMVRWSRTRLAVSPAMSRGVIGWACVPRCRRR